MKFDMSMIAGNRKDQQRREAEETREIATTRFDVSQGLTGIAPVEDLPLMDFIVWCTPSGPGMATSVNSMVSGFYDGMAGIAPDSDLPRP
jgi:hypothetical protein